MLKSAHKNLDDDRRKCRKMMKSRASERAPLRTFIAADLPDEILQKINKITAYFKTQTPPRAVKWVDSSNLHLTIKFLGEIKKEVLPAAQALIQDALKGCSAFSVSVQGLGMFPNDHRPRVIWLGIEDGAPLHKIHTALEQNLKELGIKPDKRGFHPHLTLGRVRRQVPLDEVEAIGQTLNALRVDRLGATRIEEIILYQSELTPQGPVYTPLFAVPLLQV